MKIGYARVSTDEQHLYLQRDALKKAGCDKIITDTGVSGQTRKRDGLDRAMKHVKKGDVLVVWKLGVVHEKGRRFSLGTQKAFLSIS